MLCIIFAQGRDKDMWGEDALEFKPERWIIDGKLRGMPSENEYSVFHAGPRSCLGQRMARLETSICLSTLMKNMSFSLAVNPTTVTYKLSLTLVPEPGSLLVNIEPPLEKTKQ